MHGEKFNITTAVAAICRDACEKFVDESGEVSSSDPMWPVIREVMTAYHHFAKAAGYREGVS